jgi:hypothetical protein
MCGLYGLREKGRKGYLIMGNGFGQKNSVSIGGYVESLELRFTRHYDFHLNVGGGNYLQSGVCLAVGVQVWFFCHPRASGGLDKQCSYRSSRFPLSRE